MKDSKISSSNQSRRDFIKKAAYVPPAIMSLKALSSFALAGSAGQTPPRVRDTTNRWGKF